jgi:hypothetical protein
MESVKRESGMPPINFTVTVTVSNCKVCLGHYSETLGVFFTLALAVAFDSGLGNVVTVTVNQVSRFLGCFSSLDMVSFQDQGTRVSVVHGCFRRCYS